QETPGLTRRSAGSPATTPGTTGTWPTRAGPSDGSGRLGTACSTRRRAPLSIVRRRHPRSSHLLDLPVLQFQGGGAPEDRGDDPDHALVGDDLLDLALEVLERAVGDLDLVALLVLGLQRHLVVGLLRLLQHLGLVAGRHRGRLAVGAAE